MSPELRLVAREVRRLQKASVVLACLAQALARGEPVNVGDAIEVARGLVDEALDALGRVLLTR